MTLVGGVSGGLGTTQILLPEGATLESGLRLTDPINLRFVSLEAEVYGGLEKEIAPRFPWRTRLGAGAGVKTAHTHTKIRSSLLRVDDQNTQSATFLYVRMDIAPKPDHLLENMFVRGEIRQYNSSAVSATFGLSLAY
jgi:hypothetical protein